MFIVINTLTTVLTDDQLIMVEDNCMKDTDAESKYSIIQVMK